MAGCKAIVTRSPGPGTYRLAFHISPVLLQKYRVLMLVRSAVVRGSEVACSRTVAGRDAGAELTGTYLQRVPAGNTRLSSPPNYVHQPNHYVTLPIA